MADEPHTRLDAAIRAYWNERIHDVRLSDDPPGSAAFYTALDRYRLRRCRYLTRVVDFGAWAGRDVLEIGCGAGLDLVRFARKGARVTGVDVAERALALARGCCEASGVEATLLEADGARLPFADARFDLVYCHGVLPFTRDPAGVIAESHRVLRPGGTAIMMVYHRRSWMRLALCIPGWEPGHADAPAFRLYDRREFQKMLTAFTDCALTIERLPTAVEQGAGPAARIAGRWLRPLGWHLMARCRKGM